MPSSCAARIAVILRSLREIVNCLGPKAPHSRKTTKSATTCFDVSCTTTARSGGTVCTTSAFALVTTSVPGEQESSPIRAVQGSSCIKTSSILTLPRNRLPQLQYFVNSILGLILQHIERNDTARRADEQPIAIVVVVIVPRCSSFETEVGQWFTTWHSGVNSIICSNKELK